ncbi:MAG: hypothetical protein QXO69_00645 [archaeon]
MKGQIFTLDALLAIALVTALIGMTALCFERVYSQSESLNYLEIAAMADDWSQIAVRNVLLDDSYQNASVLKTDMSALKAMMDASIKSPYSYEAVLSTGQSIGGSCSGKANVASSVRHAFIGGTSAIGNLTVKICV